MKILHFHPDVRMAARFVLPLIMEERKQGYNSSLIVSRSRGENVKKIRYDLTVKNIPLLFISFVKILKILRSENVSLIISHNTKSSLIPLFAAWVLRVEERVYFNHGVPYIGHRGILRAFLKCLEAINCFFATKVLTVSEDMAELIRPFSPTTAPRLIHYGSACGLDFEDMNTSRYKKGDFRRTLGFDENDFLVVFNGRPERRKGFLQVLQIWGNFPPNSKFKLILCGPAESDVLSVLPEIPQNIVCLGFVDNVAEVLSDSDVLILPSMHEGLSYAVLEAMACGCVVVANDIPGLRCIVDNGVNGYLVTSNLQETYVDILQRLESNQVAVYEMLLAAKDVVSKFDRQKFLPEYAKFVNNINENCGNIRKY